MRDLRDKSRLAVTVFRRGNGLRGKISALRYISKLVARYLGRKLPMLGRLFHMVEGGSELRSESHSDIDQPTAVYRLELLQFKLADFPVRIDRSRAYTLNFFLPTIDPFVIFGVTSRLLTW